MIGYVIFDAAFAAVQLMAPGAPSAGFCRDTIASRAAPAVGTAI